MRILYVEDNEDNVYVVKKRFARDIELANVIDESVIGGAVLDAGGVVIDGSVAGRLKALESALTH